LIISLHDYCLARQWTSFENRSTFGEVMDKSMMSYFESRGRLEIQQLKWTITWQAIRPRSTDTRQAVRWQ